MTPYEFHPLADLFPMMDADRARELAEGILKNGLLHPIVLHEGKILDGRNRYRACLSMQVPPKFTTYSGPSPAAFVAQSNLCRRDLTMSQRAMIAKEMLPFFEAEAKARMSAGGKGAEQIPDLGDSRDHAAAALGVNPRYVSDAKAIAAASPETAERVKAGELSIPAAKKEIAAKAEPNPEPEPPPAERLPSFAPSNGLQFADMAIAQLERIHAKDTQRKEAFAKITRWIAKQK